LSKLRGLLVNEYIKIFGKLSTRILLGLVILGALGFNGIIYLVSRQTSLTHATPFGGALTAYELRNIAQERGHDQWERDATRYDYFIANLITHTPTVYVQGVRIEQHPEAWRTQAVYTLFDFRWLMEDGLFPAAARPEAAAIHAAMDEAILAGDWLAFTSAFHRGQELHYRHDPAPELAIAIWATEQALAHNAYPGSWQYHAIYLVQTAKTSLLHHDERHRYFDAQDVMRINLYRLEQGIPGYLFPGMEFAHFHPHTMHLTGIPGIWAGFAASLEFIGTLLGAFLIIIAGGVIAGEYAGGTIKFLLINPVARWKFLLAKYVAVLTVGLGVLALLFFANFIFSGLFFGFGGLSAPFLSVVEGEVVRRSAWLYIASRYLLGMAGAMVLATFAFALSALVRSAALAIGLSMFLFLGGWGAVALLRDLGFYQARYILFANTNLLSVIGGYTGFAHHTLGFALLNIAAHMIVFLWTAWDAFVRTDIK